ncbi:hypothetical protein BVX95_01115 [archaeon D22]|nr:hypothetical protein BVX95_01115 [archaeon D22]
MGYANQTKRGISMKQNYQLLSILSVVAVVGALIMFGFGDGLEKGKQGNELTGYVTKVSLSGTDYIVKTSSHVTSSDGKTNYRYDSGGWYKDTDNNGKRDDGDSDFSQLNTDHSFYSQMAEKGHDVAPVQIDTTGYYVDYNTAEAFSTSQSGDLVPITTAKINDGTTITTLYFEQTESQGQTSYNNVKITATTKVTIDGKDLEVPTTVQDVAENPAQLYEFDGVRVAVQNGVAYDQNNNGDKIESGFDGVSNSNGLTQVEDTYLYHGLGDFLGFAPPDSIQVNEESAPVYFKEGIGYDMSTGRPNGQVMDYSGEIYETLNDHIGFDGLVIAPDSEWSWTDWDFSGWNPELGGSNSKTTNNEFSVLPKDDGDTEIYIIGSDGEKHVVESWNSENPSKATQLFDEDGNIIASRGNDDARTPWNFVQDNGLIVEVKSGTVNGYIDFTTGDSVHKTLTPTPQADGSITYGDDLVVLDNGQVLQNMNPGDTNDNIEGDVFMDANFNVRAAYFDGQVRTTDVYGMMRDEKGDIIGIAQFDATGDYKGIKDIKKVNSRDIVKSKWGAETQALVAANRLAAEQFGYDFEKKTDGSYDMKDKNGNTVGFWGGMRVALRSESIINAYSDMQTFGALSNLLGGSDEPWSTDLADIADKWSADERAKRECSYPFDPADPTSILMTEAGDTAIAVTGTISYHKEYIGCYNITTDVHDDELCQDLFDENAKCVDEYCVDDTAGYQVPLEADYTLYIIEAVVDANKDLWGSDDEDIEFTILLDDETYDVNGDEKIDSNDTYVVEKSKSGVYISESNAIMIYLMEDDDPGYAKVCLKFSEMPDLMEELLDDTSFGDDTICNNFATVEDKNSYGDGYADSDYGDGGFLGDVIRESHRAFNSLMD